MNALFDLFQFCRIPRLDLQLTPDKDKSVPIDDEPFPIRKEALPYPKRLLDVETNYPAIKIMLAARFQLQESIQRAIQNFIGINVDLNSFISPSLLRIADVFPGFIRNHRHFKPGWRYVEFSVPPTDSFPSGRIYLFFRE